jgi:phosphoglycerate dehydrogenase-like enzyme
LSEIIWSQWEDLIVPSGFTHLHPGNFDLEKSDLSGITFYVPQYMSGQKGLEFTRKMSSLKHLQMPNAGVDDALAYVNPGVNLYNARGVHDASTAELAVALAISARRGFYNFAKAQFSGIWQHKRYSSFNDSKIAILGNGSIAKTLNKYLSVYDVEIVHFSRTASDGAMAITDFDAKISYFDVIFLVLPLNKESRGFFNENRMLKMKHGATLVNVARGAIVDTDALVKVLNSGLINAGLDVTDPEPLPAGHQLWSAKNCVITPHVGGDSTAFDSRCKKLVESQLAKLAAGEPLLNKII